jgi:hypothetical protein
MLLSGWCVSQELLSDTLGVDAGLCSALLLQLAGSQASPLLPLPASLHRGLLAALLPLLVSAAAAHGCSGSWSSCANSGRRCMLVLPMATSTRRASTMVPSDSWATQWL